MEVEGQRRSAVTGALRAQSSRATATATRVRFFGVLAFLPILALLQFFGGPGWNTYLFPMLGFAAIAGVLFACEKQAWVATVGPYAFVLDVILIFEVQRLSLPNSPFPAGVAGFSLGLFALSVAMTASTMKRAATWLVAASATVCQCALMQLAGVSLGAQATAAIVLCLLAVTQNQIGERLRNMVRGLAATEVAYRREHDQVTELTAARRQIEGLLESARAHNSQMVSLQADKEALTSLLIHDLRAPLGALRANIEWLKEELRGNPDPEIDSALTQSRQVTDRVTGMIGDLLNITRLESGQMPLSPEARPARAIVESLFRQLQAQGRERRVEVELEADDSVLEADHELLLRALENVSSNALRYTPSGGRIRIEARGAGDEVHFSVRNSGPVIPANVRATLFEKYVQAGSTTDNRRAGWGLGLYFCKLCVDAHKGRIAVEDCEGWPTSFVLRIPGAMSARDQRAA